MKKYVTNRNLLIFIGLLLILFNIYFNEWSLGIHERKIYSFFIRILNIIIFGTGIIFIIFSKRINLKKLSINLLVSIISIIVSLLIIEILLRIIRPEYKYAAESRLIDNQTRIWGNPQNSRYYADHPDLEKKHLVINNLFGFRQHREFGLDKQENTIRIGVFGDSYAENIRIPAQYSFTEPLEYLLNKSGKKFEVLNFGTDGYGTGQVYLQYLQEGRKFNLDYVIYIYCNNDLRNILEHQLIFINEKGGIEIWKSKPKRIYASFMKNLYMTYLFIDLSQRFGINVEQNIDEADHRRIKNEWKKKYGNRSLYKIESDFAAGKVSQEVNSTLKLFLSILDDLDKQVKQDNAQLVVGTLPSTGGDKMASFLIEQNFDVINFFNKFNTIYQNNEYRFINDHHWNEEGNKLAAVYLFEYLAEKMALEYDHIFIEQSLFEYYSSFDTTQVSSLFIRKHYDFPGSLNKKIKLKYLYLE